MNAHEISSQCLNRKKRERRNKGEALDLDVWFSVNMCPLVNEKELLLWWNDYVATHPTLPSDKDLTEFLLKKYKALPLSNKKVNLDKRTLNKYKKMLSMFGDERHKISYTLKTKDENRAVAGTSVRNCTSFIHGLLRLAFYEKNISKKRRHILERNAAYMLLRECYPGKLDIDFLYKHFLLNADTFSCELKHSVGRSELKFTVRPPSDGNRDMFQKQSKDGGDIKENSGAFSGGITAHIFVITNAAGSHADVSMTFYGCDSILSETAKDVNTIKVVRDTMCGGQKNIFLNFCRSKSSQKDISIKDSVFRSSIDLILKPFLMQIRKMTSDTGSSTVDWNSASQRAIFLMDGALEQVKAFEDRDIQRKFREELYTEVLKLAAGASWTEQPNDLMRAHPIFRSLLRKLREITESVHIDEIDAKFQKHILQELLNAKADGTEEHLFNFNISKTRTVLGTVSKCVAATWEIIDQAFSKKIIQDGYIQSGIIDEFGLPCIDKMAQTCTKLSKEERCLIQDTFTEIHREYVDSIPEDLFDKLKFRRDVGLDGREKVRSNKSHISRQRAVILTRTSMVEDKKRKRAEERLKKQKKRHTEKLHATMLIQHRTTFLQKMKEKVLERFKKTNRRHDHLSWYRHVKPEDFRGFNNTDIRNFLKCVFNSRIPPRKSQMIQMAINLLQYLNRKCNPLRELTSIVNSSESEPMDVASSDEDEAEIISQNTCMSIIHVGNRLNEAGTSLLLAAYNVLNLPSRFRSVVTYDVFCSFCRHMSKRVNKWVFQKAPESERTHPSFKIPLLHIPIMAGYMFENLSVKIPVSKEWNDSDLERCILAGADSFEEFDPIKMMNMGAVYMLDCPLNGLFRAGMTVDAIQRKSGSSGHDRMVRSNPTLCTSYLYAPHEVNSALFPLTTSRWEEVRFLIALRYNAVTKKVLMNEELWKLWDFSLPLRHAEQNALVKTRRVGLKAEDKARIVLYSFEIAYGCCQSPVQNLNESAGFEKYRPPSKKK